MSERKEVLVRVVLRVSLPDRPGALSAVAAALSRVGADIACLDVIDRGDGIAVDDICVTTANGLGRDLRRLLEQVPGVIVEALREVRQFPDPGAPMELAAGLVEHGRGAVRELVAGLPEALRVTWCLAIASGMSGPEILASSTSDGAEPPPSLEDAEICWLPLPGPRRLKRAEWMPAAWRAQVDRGLELAAAPLGPSPTAVLVGRLAGPRFRSQELRQLGCLARVAIATEVGVAGRLKAGSRYLAQPAQTPG